MVTLRTCAVTDSMSCWGGVDFNWEERMCCLCRKVRGKFGQSEPEGAREDMVGTKTLGAESSKNDLSKANGGRCD
jgi:hypothetical protein